MSRRSKTLVLATLFTAAMGAYAAPAWGDPPPWAARWNKHGRGLYHDHSQCNDPSHDHYRYRGRPSYRSYRYDTGSGGRCGEFLFRIEKANQTIRQWEGTGRHEKVVQWYRGDRAQAVRGLDRCRRDPRIDRPYRGDRVRYEPRYDDPYPGAYGADPYGGDPYYGSQPYGGKFDWKRDWPLVVAPLINSYQNR